MKWGVFLAILGIAIGANASSFAIPLRTGDVLLQSVPCYLCSLIEIEENSPYSHMGIAVVEGTSISVLESWQKVERIPLQAFLKKRKANTHTRVLRPLAFAHATARVSTRSFLAVFDRWFAGKPYDARFSWDDSDELYCSEFVAKFLNHFLPEPIPTKSMHFQKYREDWIRYFKGTPPDGRPGISPADFERSSLFLHLGFLD